MKYIRDIHRRHPHIFAALFFMLLQVFIVAALMNEMATKNYIFWYCNNIAFFIAIALYEGNMQAVKGLSYVGFLPQLLWIADFIAHMFGSDLSNTANYIFVSGFTFSNDVAVIIHFSIPLVAYFYTLRVRPAPYSLFYSMLYIVGLYVVTLAGTAPIDDMNCVFNACADTSFPYHVILWPLYMMILTLGAFALHEYGYRLYNSFHARREAQIPTVGA